MDRMNHESKIVIVSAFGRGNWLAVEFRSMGFQVSLVDVTNHLGVWAPEDIEGPFGYFQPDSLLQTQKARLDQEDYADMVDEGFVVWPSSGPLDTRGPHSPYLLERRQIGVDVLEYLEQYDRLPEKRRAELNKKLKQKSFQESWLAHLAHSMASPVYAPNSEALKRGRPLPLFSPLAVRRVSRRGVEKSFEWLKGVGVTCFENARLKDISISGRLLQSLEIESEWSGVMAADQFIWTLSSAETRKLGEKYLEELYPDGALRPDWVWQRYRVDLQNRNLYDFMPLKYVVLDDPALPWTHANLQLVQKTSSLDSLDSWVRIPEVHRFQKGYLEEMGSEILSIMKKRFPACEPKIIDYPQDYLYDETQLGPARFSVFDYERREQLKRRVLTNLHFDGSELWESLDWTGQFSHQKKILEIVKAWKTELDHKIEKMKERERQRLEAQNSDDRDESKSGG